MIDGNKATIELDIDDKGEGLDATQREDPVTLEVVEWLEALRSCRVRITIEVVK